MNHIIKAAHDLYEKHSHLGLAALDTYAPTAGYKAYVKHHDLAVRFWKLFIDASNVEILHADKKIFKES